MKGIDYTGYELGGRRLGIDFFHGGRLSLSRPLGVPFSDNSDLLFNNFNRALLPLVLGGLLLPLLAHNLTSAPSPA